MRFGIAGRAIVRLKGGKVFNVTRERIRQIEAKAYASCAIRPVPTWKSLERVGIGDRSTAESIEGSYGEEG